MCSNLRLDVLLLVFSCCFVMTSQQTDLWCYEHNELCYTVYTTPRVQIDAAAECQQLHTNGRLVTILNSKDQRQLDYVIKLEHRLLEYWIGAKLQGLSEWTWVNNQPFEDTANLSIPADQHNVKGYATIRKVANGVRMRVVPLSDPLCRENDYYHNHKHALCKRHDRSDSRRFYLIVGRNWHEARHYCTYYGDADLAVLTDADISILLTIMKQDFYFIGLSNVRLIWSVGGQAKVSTYFNWVDTATWSHGENACVYASITAPYGDSKWNTSYCNIPRPFICEYENPKHASLTASTRTTTTSATTATSETEQKTLASLTDTEQSPLHDGSNNKPPQSGEFIMWILLGGLVLLILAAVVVIVGVIFYFKRKSSQSESHQRQQRQSYTNLQTQNTYDEYQPQYAAVHQPNVPDVCFGTTAGNRPDESAQYAEVGSPTIATDDGTQYANLPAGLPQTQAKKRKKKQPASAPTIHLSAATSASEAASDVGGTVYASIVPTIETQQTDRAEDNEYEMPTQQVVYASFDSC